MLEALSDGVIDCRIRGPYCDWYLYWLRGESVIDGVIMAAGMGVDTAGTGAGAEVR